MSEDKDLETLKELQNVIVYALDTWASFVAMTPEEKEKFSREHPGADMVIGNFEIRKIKR